MISIIKKMAEMKDKGESLKIDLAECRTPSLVL